MATSKKNGSKLSQSRNTDNDLEPVQVDGFHVEEVEVKAPEPEVVELPKPRRFTPRDCSLCTENRKRSGMEGKSFTQVYGQAGNLRYCRCKFCGNSWKESGQ